MKPRRTKGNSRQRLLSLLVQRIVFLGSEALRIAKEYWLSIQKYTAGRKLRGVELHVAKHAYYRLLEEADRQARRWNETRNGKLYPIEVQVDWSDPSFAPPQPMYSDGLQSEVLAAISGSLLPRPRTKLSDDEAIQRAHDLLLAADRYIASLPTRPATAGAEAAGGAKVAFSSISFEEIRASNRADSGRLPLLPSLQQKRKGMKEDDITGTQTLKAIRRAVREFLERKRLAQVDEAEFDRSLNQDNLIRASQGKPPEDLTCQAWRDQLNTKIERCMRDNEISVLDLCILRWERFKKQSEGRRDAATRREMNKRALRQASSR